MSGQLRIGILGEPDRTLAWEKYLRIHPSVAEVVCTTAIPALGDILACILLDESDALNNAIHFARHGLHVFLVCRIPTDLPMLIRLQHTVEESHSVAQFVNWAYFHPISLWMMEQMPRPRVLHSYREVPLQHVRDHTLRLDNLWLEDLSLVLKWVDSGVHKIESHTVVQANETVCRHAWLQFDNGTSATFSLSQKSASLQHKRLAFDTNTTIEADIIARKIHLNRTQQDTLPYEVRDFTSELPVQQAITRFLKAIQMRRAAEYGIFDVVRLARTLAAAQTTLLR
jgi:hypothetical protein